MSYKAFLRTSLKSITLAIRHILKPKKYKSIGFLCELLGNDVTLNEKARAIKNKIVTHICTTESQFFPKDNACLVYTNPVRGISDYSDSAKKAIQDGAMALITSQSFSEYPCIISNNPLKVYSHLCKYYRELQPRVKVTAITGSIGKSTTKNMIGEVYKTCFKTFYTEENDNTKTTIGFAVQHIPDCSEMMVQEVAESEPDETQWLSLMLRPEVVVITSIDKSHIEFMGSTEKIIEECCSATRFMSDNGTVIVNKDEFSRYDLLNNRKALTISITEPDADFYASDIEEDVEGLSFLVHIKENGEFIRVKLNNMYARHNVQCALYAFAAGYCQGISLETIVKGLSNYHTSGVRQNVIKTPDNITLYVDCYNAVAKSMKSAIEACDTIPVLGKRIAVLGDIEEVGDLSESMHKDVITYVNESRFDVLLIIGSKFKNASDATPVRDSLLLRSFDDLDTLSECLMKMVSSGDLVLFKASHSSHLAECIIKVWPDLEPIVYNAKKFRNLRKVLSLFH